MNKEENSKVPPDGKWGWIIVLAYALNGISVTSIIQAFGLVFKDTFPSFGFSATEGTIILNVNLAFGMILGLLYGPLLRIFGYRKVAIAGSTIYSAGLVMTSFSRSFTLLLISYSILVSCGSWMATSAFSYALNSYFTTRRNRATSLGVTIIGLGSIIMPQVATFLISYYGPQGTILIYGAFSFHSFLASLLLHPLKWHLKDADKPKDANEELLTDDKKSKLIGQKDTSFQEDACSKTSALDLTNIQQRRRTSNIDSDVDSRSIYGFDIAYARQMSETLNVSIGEADLGIYTIVENDQTRKERSKRQFHNDQFKSMDTINLGSSMKIFDEKPLRIYTNADEVNANNYGNKNTMENDLLLQEKEEKKISNAKNDKNEKFEKKTRKQIFHTIAGLLDLDLLQDPIYVNLTVGMSAAIFAEINFSQLTPFILMDMHLSTTQIASVMSIIASVDLVFRAFAPFLGEWLRQPPRMMYMLSLCLLIISRMSLLLVSGFISMISVAVGLGAAKGIRSVYMSLVIPTYVPINKLANASGIQMIVNGLILLSAGPLLGVMRDSFGTYTSCIIVMNCVTALTVVMWSVEILIVRRKRLQTKRTQAESL
ncbi:uncharacterized protein LOC143432822 [Xylocopa sonorina]|uniref:uncharacterized protein LOC143432822 n=1 Tax=Xylocopa sonorina TaxID=1818115 RepID=UPI00403ADBA1